MTRTRRMLRLVAAGLVVAVVGAACSKNSGASGGFNGVALTGAGATFPKPIYSQWFADFQKVESGAKINYQAIGSGGGVTQFTQQTVDFGASEAPLKAAGQSALPGGADGALEIPTVLGGVAIAYNVQGLETGLKLDGTTAADIFLGKVTTWNDPEIAALNSGVSLPSTSIQ